MGSLHSCEDFNYHCRVLNLGLGLALAPWHNWIWALPLSFEKEKKRGCYRVRQFERRVAFASLYPPIKVFARACS